MEAIIPADILSRMNSEENIVEELPYEEIPQEKASQDFANANREPSSEDYASDPLEYHDVDPAEAYLDDLAYREEHGSEEGEGFNEQDIHDLSDLVVDAVHAAKDFIKKYFHRAFRQELERTFDKTQTRHLSLIRFCDQEDNLTMQGLSEALKNAQEYDPKYKNIDFAELMNLAVTFKEIKTDFQPSPVKEYQERGIKKYTVKVIQKHFGEVKPDPVAMLILYMAVTFGGDAFRIYSNMRKNNEE